MLVISNKLIALMMIGVQKYTILRHTSDGFPSVKCNFDSRHNEDPVARLIDGCRYA